MNGPSDTTPGYLAQLVERVLPSVPPLQRRQPALFEPAQPRAGSGLHVAAAEVAAEAPAQRPHAEAPGALPLPMIRDRPTPFPEPPPHRRDALAAAPPPPRAEMPNAPEVVVRHETTTLVREAPRVDASFRAAPLAVTSWTRAATAAPTVTPKALPERAPETRAAAPRAAIPAVDARTPVPHATVPPTESTHRAVPVRDEVPLPRRARQPASPPPPDTRPRASSPPAPSRAASRAAVQAALRQSALPPPRELPPVEVTIGRVEVRAVAAPPGAVRGARPAPRLSLEQYLNDRNGGRR